MKPLPVVMFGFALFVGVLIIGSILITRKSAPATVPAPTPDPLETVRLFAAKKIEDALKENGCPKCEAYPDDKTLRITHPQLAPRAVASALFANKKTVEALKKAGFKTVSIDQGGGAFTYKIK